MLDLLTQAFSLTVVGMGMTFASIGALVGGMYLLTALFADKPDLEETPASETEAPADLPTDVHAREARHVAAAAAVAVALAQASRRTEAAGAGLSRDQWTTYVRERDLASRARYDALRAGR